MFYEFNSLHKQERLMLYDNLYKTYIKSTGVLTFNKKSFAKKFKDTIIVGDIQGGGFIVRIHYISGHKHYKLVAGFSKWFDHFSAVDEYMSDKNAYIFVTENLVETFEKNGFTCISDVNEIIKYMNDEMTIKKNGVEQKIKNIILNKKMLIKFNATNKDQ